MKNYYVFARYDSTENDTEYYKDDGEWTVFLYCAKVFTEQERETLAAHNGLGRGYWEELPQIPA